MTDVVLKQIIQVLADVLSPEIEKAAEEIIKALPPGEKRDDRISLLGELRACREIAEILRNAQSHPEKIDMIVQHMTYRLKNSLLLLFSEEESAINS